MTAKVERTEKNTVVLEITVPAAELTTAMDKASKKIAKEVNIPGFRKGKVPQAILRNYVGVESILEQAAEDIFPNAYMQAVEEHNVDVVDRPSVETIQLEEGKDVIYKATVTVKPEFTLGKYVGVEVEKTVNVPTEEDVTKEIDRMRQRLGKLEQLPTDTVVEAGDQTLIDFAGSIDGELFEGGSAQEYELTLGSNTFIPGFEDQVIGMKIGEEKDVNVTFPEDYHQENLAGKPAVFKVNLRGARRKVLPELNDDFVKDISEELDTVAALKDSVMSDLTKRAAMDSEAKAKADALKQVLDGTEIDLPEVMIERRIDYYVEDFEQQVMSQGLSLDLFFQYTNSDMAALREQNRERATLAVKQDLVLKAIVEAEHIVPSEEDIQKSLEEIAQAYGQSVDTVKESFEKSGRLDLLTENLALTKAVDFIFDNAKITEK